MLIEIFKPIIENLSTTKLDFNYGHRAFQNLTNDRKAVKMKFTENVPKNIFWIDSELRGSIPILKTPTKELIFNCEIVIGFKSQLDLTPEQRYPFIELGIAVQKEIIEALIKDASIQNVNGQGVSNWSFTFIENLFDANYDCFVCTFNLKVKDLQPRCAY